MSGVRRLLFITDAPHFGGAERYIIDMAAAARRCGIETVVLWLKSPAADARALAACNPDVPRIITQDQPHGAPGPWAAARNLLATERPDAVIINASGRPGFWLLPFAARLGGTPCAWVHHMLDTRDHRRLTPRLLGGRLEGLQAWRVPQMLRHALAARAATAVITSNPTDRDYVARWHRAPRSRLHVIAPGIDCDSLKEPQPATVRHCPAGSGNEFIVGTAARLTDGKGVNTLIQALAMLRDSGLNVQLRIAGDGPEREHLEHLAAKLGVSGSVSFLGRLDDLSAFYASLHAFALASQTESFGLVLTEAMAAGLPVVATPTAGARYQIKHRETGWLLNSFGPLELAEALRRLAADAAGRHEMGRRARAAATSNFNIDRTLGWTLAALRASRRTCAAVPRPCLALEDLR